jgi:hypothetical protein
MARKITKEEWLKLSSYFDDKINLTTFGARRMRAPKVENL